MSGARLLDADMRTVAGWASAGLRWWIDELAAMVPDRLRRRTEAEAAYPVAGPQADAIDLTDCPDLTGKVMVLPPGYCLLRRTECPAMGDRDLEQMVALDADRLMPLGRDGTIVAARRVRQGPGDPFMLIEVAGLARNRAERLCREIGARGEVPAAILASAPAADGARPVDLLPALRRAGLLPKAGGAAARWWIAVLFLFALNGGMLIWRDVAARDSLRQLVAEQQPAVDAAHRIRGRILLGDRMAAQTLAARARREPLAILTRLGAALPPGVWLQRYSWHGDSLRLSGYRPARADISGALRQAGLTGIRYDEATAAAATPLGQPFDITASLARP